MPAPQQLERYLSRPEAAEYLQVKEQTLAAWHCTGRYQLPCVKVGGRARYRLSDLEKWLRERTTTQTS